MPSDGTPPGGGVRGWSVVAPPSARAPPTSAAEAAWADGAVTVACHDPLGCWTAATGPCPGTLTVTELMGNPAATVTMYRPPPAAAAPVTASTADDAGLGSLSSIWFR